MSDKRPRGYLPALLALPPREREIALGDIPAEHRSMVAIHIERVLMCSPEFYARKINMIRGSNKQTTRELRLKAFHALPVEYGDAIKKEFRRLSGGAA